MQWKIERSGAFSDALNRWAIRRGFPILLWLAPRVPRWFLRGGARTIMGVVFFFHSKPRPAIARNLARVLGEAPDSRAVRRATNAMIRHFAYYWADLFRFAQLPPDRLRDLVADRGESTLEPLRRMRAGGQKALLLTAHLGNWELGAVMLGGVDLPLSVVYVRDAFEDAEKFRSRLRGAADVQEIPIEPGNSFSSLPIVRALAQGRFVALQGDRDFNDAWIEVPLFGAPTRMPTGPFLLARMSGAPILPTFIAYTDDYRFEVVLDEPIAVDRTDDREADLSRALGRWATILERAIRRWPTQWYNFHDVWPQPAGEPTIAAAPEATADATPLATKETA